MKSTDMMRTYDGRDIKTLDYRGETLKSPDPSRIDSVMVQYIVDKGQQLQYAKLGDAGMDLPVILEGLKEVKAVGEPLEDVTLTDFHEEHGYPVLPKHYVFFPTGLRVKVPENSWGYIKTRSSTAPRRGLHVVETVIDAGYTGPLYSVVFNPHDEAITIKEGDKLAQLVLVPLFYPTNVCIVDELPKTERGQTGFGSSTPEQMPN